MRWGDSEHQFVRPVHGLILLHGDRVVPARCWACQRPHHARPPLPCDGEITIATADEYEAEAAGRARSSPPSPSVARSSPRRSSPRPPKNSRRQASTLLDGLLDEVTALVEWPAVYVGEFEAEYLEVPQECLILTMQQNQKYFPLLDGEGQAAQQAS
jgi:glycyl-tRNA synthetase beta chain